MTTPTPAGRAVVGTDVQDNTAKGVAAITARFKRAAAKISKISKKAAIGAAAIAAPLLASSKQFAAAGDRIDKFSKRTNLSVKASQSFGFAMEQSGSEMEALEPAIKKLNAQMIDFERGSKEAVDNFSDLGISFSELQNLDTADRFRLILEKLQEIPDAGRRAGLANKILGKSGSALLPLLGNLKALEKEYDEMGVAMTKEQVEAAAKMTDAYNKVTKQFQKVAIEIGSALAPMLIQLAENFGPIIGSVGDWIAANPTLISSLGILAGSLGAVAIALKTISFLMLSNPFTLIATGITAAIASLIVFRKEIEGVINRLLYAVGLSKQDPDGGGDQGGGSVASAAIGAAKQTKRKTKIVKRKFKGTRQSSDLVPDVFGTNKGAGVLGVTPFNEKPLTDLKENLSAVATGPNLNSVPGEINAFKGAMSTLGALGSQAAGIGSVGGPSTPFAGMEAKQDQANQKLEAIANDIDGIRNEGLVDTEELAKAIAREGRK